MVRALAALPLASLFAPRRAEAVDYANAAEVFAAIDRLTVVVAVRLAAIGERVPDARAFARSVARDHARFGKEREGLRRRLGIGQGLPVHTPSLRDALSVEALRLDQEALVHAHAEGLPALHDAFAVDVLAGHMVELARHLTVIELWLEGEENRG